jgi:hypothetical protein
MGILHRKSRWERVIKPVVDSLDLPKGVKSGLADPPKAVKSGVAAVGGVLGLTVGSAVVSSLRHREGDGS